MKPVDVKLNREQLLRDQAYIGGQWVDAQSKKSYPVYDPATGGCIIEVPSMTKVETAQAIDAAHKAFGDWKSLTAMERSILLKKFYSLINQHSEDLAKILTWECGKPIAEARAEISTGAAYIEYYAHECIRKEGFVVPTPWKGHKFIVINQPIGVASMITPWNFPMSMLARKIAPALAAGCTTVIKPAEDTPLSALALCQIADEAGIPKGVINVVTGPREHSSEIGSELALSKKVRKLSFTGSTSVGKLLMEQCASNVKKVCLELGGNAPFLVFEDANIDDAVAGAIASKFRNAGQTCVCSNRFFVHASVHDEFVEKFADAVKKFKIGHGLTPGVQQGPLINSAAVEKASRLVSDATSKGAKTIVGGGPHACGPNFFEPTILTGITSDMDISKQEIFGPIAPIFKFTDEEEVVDLANDTDSGLAGFFYSRDIGRIWRVAERLECGMVGVNCGILTSPLAPFGGVKESGLGREGSPLGLDEYVESKYICIAGLDK